MHYDRRIIEERMKLVETHINHAHSRKFELAILLFVLALLFVFFGV